MTTVAIHRAYNCVEETQGKLAAALATLRAAKAPSVTGADQEIRTAKKPFGEPLTFMWKLGRGIRLPWLPWRQPGYTL
jgi:hypothetical protein